MRKPSMMALNCTRSLSSETKPVWLIKTSWFEIKSSEFLALSLPSTPRPPARVSAEQEGPVVLWFLHLPSTPLLTLWSPRFLTSQAWNRAEMRGRRWQERSCLTGTVTSWLTLQILAKATKVFFFFFFLEQQFWKELVIWNQADPFRSP